MIQTLSIIKSTQSIPQSIKNGPFPLTGIDRNLFEGIQKGIPLFDDGDKLISLDDIDFTATKLETFDIFRGCDVGCTHCLKNAKPYNKNKRSILFEDLIRFTDGFKTLSERFGFNVLNGNKYLNIIDDSNPTDYKINGLTGEHDVVEAIKQIYESLKLPVLFVTSGWNKKSQNSVELIAKEFKQNPQSLRALEVSINPFLRIMEHSRNALKNGELSKARMFRNQYTDRMANTFLTFFDLFKGEKPQGRIIYRHANNYDGNELVGENEIKKLYFEIYEKLKNILGEKIDEAPTLKPEIVTKFDKSHLIEPSGRGRNYFPYEYNAKVQSELIHEFEEWDQKSFSEKKQFLKDFSVKCVDIDGRVYSTYPAIYVQSEYSPVELTVPSDVQLNYINRPNVPPVFSDINLIESSF